MFGKAPAKNWKSQKVKSQKVSFSPFRLFGFSTFWLFFFPLGSQRFKLCTFSCACSAGKASGKNSNSQKVKSQFFDFSKFNITRSYFSILRLFEIHKKAPFHLTIFCISTFRNSIRNLSIFRLFVFRLFEIDLNTFRQEPCSTFFLPSFSPYFIHLILSRVSQITAINEHSPP
jgi:hypothetical protein